MYFCGFVSTPPDPALTGAVKSGHPKHPKNMNVNRLAVNIFFFGNGFLYANWISRLPRLQEIYDLNYADTGVLLLILAVGALLAMPFAGYFIVKNGSKKITALTGICFCLFMPLVPVFSEKWHLAVLFFGMGYATGIMDVAMNAQAVLVEKAALKPIMSSFHAIFSLGATIGAGFGGLFTWLEVPLFQHILVVSVVQLMAIVFANQYLVEEEKLPDNAVSGPAFQLPDKRLIALGIIAFCCMLGEGAMADWGTNYMKHVVKSSAAIAPLGLAAFNLAMMTGRFLGDQGRIALGDYNLLIVNTLIALFGLVIVLFPMGEIIVIGGFAMVGLGLSVIVPIAYSRAGTMPGISPGVGIAMVTTIGYTGFIAGPPLLGILAEWTGLRQALFVLLLLFLIMGAMSVSQRMKFGGRG
ncbi:MAG: MFS transporter [Bacteroidetes bacterium]|nr:MAG: MFS transporter [Bacteroidota bacterium]